jgi:hypothetical protein
MQEAVTFELAAAELRALDIVLTWLPGEYRVNYRNAGDAGASLASTTIAHDGEGHPPPKDQGAQLPFAGAGAAEAARGILIAAVASSYPKSTGALSGVPLRVRSYSPRDRAVLPAPPEKGVAAIR